MTTLGGSWVRWATEQVVCVVVVGIWEAGGGGGGVGYDRGVLGGAEHGEFAGETVDLWMLKYGHIMYTRMPDSEDRRKQYLQQPPVPSPTVNASLPPSKA